MVSVSLISFELLMHILHSLSRNSLVRVILAQKLLVMRNWCLEDTSHPLVQHQTPVMHVGVLIHLWAAGVS